MTAIVSNLQAVQQQIRTAAEQARRDVHSIQLLAVSKTQTAATVRETYQAGQHAFGENYLQEALQKIAALRDLPLEWHFIGPIQSNKTRDIAENFSWVHSVDRLKIAQRLSEQRPAHLPPLKLCLQVNISQEPSKSGISVHEALALAQAIAPLPRLTLRGLMAIPAPTDKLVTQRESFAQLRQCMQAMQQQGLPLDTLSMGMSHDMTAAIQEGATIVRVGTAIFGQRS